MYVNYQQACTPDQYAVVCQHEGPILCVACPGSGKTHTLVHRAAHMVESGIDPEHILLVSFTRKASREIITRVKNLIGPRAQGIWAGTFHSVAVRLLRSHHTLLGFKSPFSVMSTGDMSDLMKIIREEAKELVQGRGQEGVKLPVTADLLKFYSEVRNKCDDMEARVTVEYSEFPDVMLWMYNQYYARKREMCLIDYDDMLFGLRYILAEKSALRAMYSRKFQYIMVDEFQDTNPVQNDIVLMLTDQHDNLMVVGDEAQSIFAFRGADITNILTITDHFPQMTVMRLEENHRSNKSIVRLLNTTLEHATEKIDKTMRSVVDAEDIKPVMYAAFDSMDQAQYVVKTIHRLHMNDVPYHDIAVLFRNAFHANQVDMLLTQKSIPFVRWGGVKFTEAAHVLDMLAFFKIRANPYDLVSWRRVLTMLPKVGPSTAQKILDVILIADDNPLTSNAADHEPWELLREFSGRGKYVPMLRLLGKALCQIDLYANTGAAFDVVWAYYQPFCQKMYVKDSEFRAHGVQQLREVAEQFPDVLTFLDEFATEDVNPDNENSDNADCLVLSTIHSAKGREWKYVFVVELIEGALPSWRNPESEEELRLFYVACSRAKVGLYLTYPRSKLGKFGSERTVQSRFLRRVESRH